MRPRRWTTHAGDWVEVRPLEEILATLDADGRLERMPFMPEMARYAGRRFRVTANAHKTCDTVHQTGGRSVVDAVHLDDLRCDGSSHDGCQAACLLFWKKAWLRPASADASAGESLPAAPAYPAPQIAHCSSRNAEGKVVYTCQATTLPEWSTLLHWWDVRQYWADVLSGNVTLRYALATLLLSALYKLRRLPTGYRLTRSIYARAHAWLRGRPDPHPRPGIQGKAPTPVVDLALQEGELVEVRSLDEINATINETFRNRGLYLSADDTRHCGHRGRVSRRVTRIINERTREMMEFTTPCIVVEGANCLGEYAEKRLLCPRRINSYWREAWLKRVPADPVDASRPVR